MKTVLSLFLLLVTGMASAQRPPADTIPTFSGPLVVHPIYHASLVLTWNNIVIYVDPHHGGKAYEGLPDPDLVLITDIHQDHLDTATLRSIETGKALFIVPQAVMDQLPADYQMKAVVLGNDEKTKQYGMRICAIPMYNLPEEPGAKHTKGRGNGYILKLGGKRIYLSGDTEDIPEMRNLKNIDVAFVCMNLPYTMGIDQAASAVLEFKPGIVYPYHYRGQDGLSDVEAFKKMVNDGDPAIEVRLRNWYPNY